MKQIKRILIANRGEVASRIIRTCKKLFIETVGIFSETDKDLPFVKEADFAFFLGDSEASESYLNQDKIIEAALKFKVDAIHPAYGFLAENYEFAKKCFDNKIIFIGPKAETIKLMGDKVEAINFAKTQNIPVIPSIVLQNKELADLKVELDKISYPVVIKASFGGGGKGIRIVENYEQLVSNIEQAKTEALKAFGKEDVFIEKYFPDSKHIEVQVIADNHGNILHLFERDCSIQRKYQKVIEETPSNINLALKEKLLGASLKLAQALEYNNVGTFEFLVTPNNDFYFLEVNTRLQVEHPITEITTKIDLVELQIKIAEDLLINFTQEEVKQENHAIEVRIYAEDPENNFYPSTGEILYWNLPENEKTRFEFSLQTHNKIESFYDAMILKVIVTGTNRLECLKNLLKTLREIVILGVKTNKDFIIKIIEHELFINYNYNTNFIENNLKDLIKNDKNIDLFLLTAFLITWSKRNESRTVLKGLPSGWRNNFYQPQKDIFYFEKQKFDLYYNYLENNKFEISIKDNFFEVSILDISENIICFTLNKITYKFYYAFKDKDIYLQNYLEGNALIKKGSKFEIKKQEEIKDAYLSPINGKITKIFVQPNSLVKEGEPILIISSMKMENTIYAFSKGIVKEIFVSENDFIEENSELLKIS